MKQKLSFPKVFLNSLFHPRATVRSVIKAKYHSFVLPFIVCYSVLQCIDPIYFVFASRYLPTPLAPLAVVVVMGGVTIILFYLTSWFAFWAGKKLKGKGKLEEVRMAIALVYCPMFIILMLSPVLDIPVWAMVFSGATDLKEILLAQSTVSPLKGFLEFVFSIWTLFPWIINVSEAHRFSKWNAFKTNLAVIGIFIAGTLVLLMLFGLLILLSQMGPHRAV